MTDIAADYNGPIDWRETFATLVQHRYADREAPAAWPLESWEPERGETPVAASHVARAAATFCPAATAELVKGLEGDGTSTTTGSLQALLGRL